MRGTRTYGDGAGAFFSACRDYRYTLWRNWGLRSRPHRALFVMLNPSTADATKNDPTIRRCINFAKSWGCGGLLVANLYALRTPNPKDIWKHEDPVGRGNDEHIFWMLREQPTVVCAWGVNAKPDRVARFVEIVAMLEARTLCLGTTKSGAPRHPLYIAKSETLRPWNPPS